MAIKLLVFLWILAQNFKFSYSKSTYNQYFIERFSYSPIDCPSFSQNAYFNEQIIISVCNQFPILTIIKTQSSAFKVFPILNKTISKLQEKISIRFDGEILSIRLSNFEHENSGSYCCKNENTGDKSVSEIYDFKEGKLPEILINGKKAGIFSYIAQRYIFIQCRISCTKGWFFNEGIKSFSLWLNSEKLNYASGAKFENKKLITAQLNPAIFSPKNQTIMCKIENKKRQIIKFSTELIFQNYNVSYSTHNNLSQLNSESVMAFPYYDFMGIGGIFMVLFILEAILIILFCKNCKQASVRNESNVGQRLHREYYF